MKAKILVVGVLLMLGWSAPIEAASVHELYRSGEYQQAKTAAEAALLTSPNDASLLYMYGLTLNQLEEYTRAVEAFRQVITLSPNHAKAYSNMSRALMEEDRDQEALEAAQRGAELNPDSNNLHALARAYFRLERYTEAEEAAQRAIRANPRNAWAHNTLGLVYLNQGRTDLARESFSAALEVSPRNMIFKRNLESAEQRLRQAGADSGAPRVDTPSLPLGVQFQPTSTPTTVVPPFSTPVIGVPTDTSAPPQPPPAFTGFASPLTGDDDDEDDGDDDGGLRPFSPSMPEPFDPLAPIPPLDGSTRSTAPDADSFVPLGQ